MTKSRELRFNAFNMTAPSHNWAGLWSHPRDTSINYNSLDYWVDYAKTAERGLLDGIFLHRDELRAYWDYSVFLRVGFAETYARMASRDGCPPDPAHPANRRYVEGQRRYLRRYDPEARASVVIDNTEPASARIVRRGR